MKLYNTLTRSIEPFQPIAPPKVGLYVCGPTVYDDPHIGHARSAYIFDVLHRYLKHRGYDVTFVRNVTDVDDKIIEKAKQELVAGRRSQVAGELHAMCREVAERYLKSYHETMGQLGLELPDREPKATEHIVPEMTDFISTLLIQGVAYEAQGNVYFSVRKFPGYGRLSNRTLDEMQAGARVEPGEHKQDPLDFALWKAAKPGEPSWSSPWGIGRPGWHIECSAMSTKYLGDAFDIHGGGVDLVFPHHENEVAQAQAAGKPFAKYWIHNGLLTVKGEKMSKSLGNFITVEQALEECGDEPDILKMFFLGTHYRSPADYTKSNLTAAGARYDGLRGFLANAKYFERLQFKVTSPPTDTTPQNIIELENEFQRLMDDDLNTPGALAVLDELAGVGYQWIEEFKQAAGDAETESDYVSANRVVQKFKAAATSIQELGKLLGLALVVEKVELTNEQRAMLDEREQARKRKDFKRADQIRNEFAEQNLVIEDTERGQVVRRKR